MKCLVLLIAIVLAGCAARAPEATSAETRENKPEANVLLSLHLRLQVRPEDGTVTYLGWYDGRRNLLGPNGMVAGLVGIEPPEMNGKLTMSGGDELRFEGTDQSGIHWVKTWRLDDRTVHVTYRIRNDRDMAFDAILYSLADLPEAQITGDNRALDLSTPHMKARFTAHIDNPHFPGEQMNPFAMRSDSKRLEPGQWLEFRMTWELRSHRDAEHK